MWQHAGVEKNADGMQRALEMLDAMRADSVPRMGLKSVSRTCNHGWFDAMDVLNMLDACTLILRSGLNRRESRGPFIRTDYPEMDNERWLVGNVLVPHADGTVSFKTLPYDLAYWRPGFARKDNLEVEW